MSLRPFSHWNFKFYVLYVKSEKVVSNFKTALSDLFTVFISYAILSTFKTKNIINKT